MDGIEIQDNYVAQIITYYIFAKEFGWTKKQVDEHDVVFIQALQKVIHYVKEKERQSRNG